MTIWAVYDHPTDYPRHFVARRWRSVEGDFVAGMACLYDSLDELRADLRRAGLTQIQPFPEDDPVIVETWI